MDFSSLNNFDYIVLFIITTSTIFALFKGFIKSFLYFFGWVLAAILTLEFYPSVSGYMAHHIQHKLVVTLTSTLGVYTILLILISVINNKIIGFASNIRGGAIDRSLGLAFGLVRGCIISSVLFWVLIMVTKAMDEKADPAWLKNAQSYKLLKIGADYIFDIVSPEETKKELFKFLDISKKVPILEKDIADGDIDEPDYKEDKGGIVEEIEEQMDHIKEAIE